MSRPNYPQPGEPVIPFMMDGSEGSMSEAVVALLWSAHANSRTLIVDLFP